MLRLLPFEMLTPCKFSKLFRSWHMLQRTEKSVRYITYSSSNREAANINVKAVSK